MTRRLIVKVCGMRDGDNIRHVEALAPDWMGFICWEGSRRHVSGVPDYLPLACRRVGVFVNPSAAYVNAKIERLGLDLVQLHGHETPDFCQAVKAAARQKGRYVEIIKAFGIAPAQPFPDTASYEDTCDYFLFDTRTPLVGGSGQAFDWLLLDSYQGRTPFLLSGGIGPDSLPALKEFSHPCWAGIDLNSRFEISPARKDVEQLSSFINTLREQLIK